MAGEIPSNCALVWGVRDAAASISLARQVAGFAARLLPFVHDAQEMQLRPQPDRHVGVHCAVAGINQPVMPLGGQEIFPGWWMGTSKMPLRTLSA